MGAIALTLATPRLMAEASRALGITDIGIRAAEAARSRPSAPSVG
jgi:hypothetical protein